MTTQDKINTIKSKVLVDFEENKTVDEVCASIASFALVNGVTFGEILPLVKTIGRDGGFIVELADRKANLMTDAKTWDYKELTYKALIEWVSAIAQEYDVPEKFASGVVKGMLKDNSLTIPVKSLLSGWKAEALACWQDNPEAPGVQEVRNWLRHKDLNHSNYTQAYHELFTELVTLGKEVK